jgi:putative two-component system response regulator
MGIDKKVDPEKMQDALIRTMAELVDRHDDDMDGHAERTQQGIKILLDEMESHGIYQDEIKKLDIPTMLQSCLLYDIGKVYIKDGILNKPARLTDEEFSEMKKHTIFGERLIGKIEAMAGECTFTRYAKIFTVSHHEKWDGTGYPRGLEGADIPLLGRMMAIVDVYDALTSVRPYKNPLTHEQAVEIITETGGTVFDPALVEMFELASAKYRK